ncbi:unnamed protein product [Discula destructiva]
MAASTPDTAATTHPLPPPPILTHPSATAPVLITQGAEGLLYRTTYLTPTLPAALKYRPSKPYRHPLLDARLTKQRILAEARILARCRRSGVAVPGVYCVDEAGGWLLLEWVPGVPVRVAVNASLGAKSEEEVLATAGADGRGLADLMRRVGAAVGRLHAAEVVHGDLTTSNMMLRPTTSQQEEAGEGGEARAGEAGVLDGEIVIIDFGLASQGTHEEERAVDLYVLERAFLSTHPRAEKLFGEVLEGYKTTFKGFKSVLRKLEDVRMRGRKRSMLG